MVEFKGWSSVKDNEPKTLKIGCSGLSDGLYIMAEVQSVPIDFLIDTGANITILSEKFVQRLQSEQISFIEGIDKCFVTATGEVFLFLAKQLLIFRYGNRD